MSLLGIEEQVIFLYRPICNDSYEKYERDLSFYIGQNLRCIRKKWNGASHLLLI